MIVTHKLYRFHFKIRRSFQLVALALALALATTSPLPSLAAGTSKGEAREAPFIGQTQIAATIMRSSRPVGVFQADVGILVINPTQRARAAALQPVLRNAWRRSTQEFANSYFIPGKVPDAVLLAQRLQAATDQILGQGSARLLLTAVIVR